MHHGVPASAVHLKVAFSSSVGQSITEMGFVQSMQSGLVLHVVVPLNVLKGI